MITVDYGFYTGDYHGTLTQAEFNRLSLKASAYVTRVTLGRVDDDTLPIATKTAVKYALCEVTDAMAANEQAVVASESNDGTSVSYKHDTSDTQRLYNAVALWLADTGLLYRGCG